MPGHLITRKLHRRAKASTAHGLRRTAGPVKTGFTSQGVTVIHAFDEFQLCTKRRALFRQDEEIRLRRKAYECLRYLIEQSPRAVPKDELCGVVWAPRIISNETLTSTIKDIRQALDDRAQPRRYVRTLCGFGYRFVAPLADQP